MRSIIAGISILSVLFMYLLAIIASFGVPIIVLWVILHFAFKFW